MENLEGIEERYKGVLGRIKRACEDSRREDGPRLLAVSKKQSCSSVRELYQCGHRAFAESYLQELEMKQSFFKEEGLQEASWSFIGRLQSNKIKRIVASCDEILSVESLKQASLIASFAKEFKKDPFPIYLLVNLGGETTKAGVSLPEVDVLVQEISLMGSLSLEGLMAIPPRFEKNEEGIKQQSKLYLEFAQKSRLVGKGKLSLGMSSDLEIAIYCGSDCVRVGTDLFGPRVD